MKKPSTTPSKRDRAARVLPLSGFTLATLEARLFLEQDVPPVKPGDLNDATLVAGLLRDTVIRPTLRNLAFLGMSPDHRIVVRNAPWIAENPDAPTKPAEYRSMFQHPAGLLLGCLLFRYLAALTDHSNNAHRSYRDAASGLYLVVDVNMARPGIQVYLPEPVALAMGHAVATHFILGKGV
ncbi:MAG: hypothetical protein ACYCSH_10245 [Acidithiobacillus sp.]